METLLSVTGLLFISANTAKEMLYLLPTIMSYCFFCQLYGGLNTRDI
ncbi:hypothetical protein Pat9b_0429 [Pantoea sp. At-9b]|nr:hypothetical protein Pat9b_0429 [Pantoea sp. At-9b]